MRKRTPPPPTDAQVLTIPEACTLLRLSRATLYRAMDAKRLPYLKYGKRRLIAREDVDAFIASMRVAAALPANWLVPIEVRGAPKMP
jgi:excisionase family DNA binding protein